MEEFDQFDLELDCGGLNFSPRRTRSGQVYKDQSSLVKRRSTKSQRKLVSSLNVAADGDTADYEENGDDSEDNCMTYFDNTNKFTKTRERKYPHDIPSSPVRQSSPTTVSPPLFSPITNTRKQSKISRLVPNSNSMSLYSLDIPESPSKDFSFSSLEFSSSAPKSRRGRFGLAGSRLRFDSDGDVLPSSCPLPSKMSSPTEPVKIANLNPFTPRAMLDATKRKLQSSLSQSYSPSWVMSQSDYSTQDSSMSPAGESEDDTSVPAPAKRLRVSDISITRYQDEFLELANIATGQFGKVIKARHRLDGIVYAIKITKKNLRANSYDEKMAMNEVFAHAALMKHKHVVRYFNSWIERGQIYIQTEFCEGGSLEEKIESCRVSGQRFPEEELRRLLLQVGKGLKYIHSRNLVHLDIKPGNILITVDPDFDPALVQLNTSSDSGAASTEGKVFCAPQLLGSIQYKIGDLGHMNSVKGGDVSPTEGDCRYMAPEFMQMDRIEPSLLPKADMFSTGMMIYEAATLRRLPRNSEDSGDYERLKQGVLPPFPYYSKEFVSLLRSLVNKKPSRRVGSSKLISNPLINPLAAKTKTQLWRELSQTKAKVLELELKLCSDANQSRKRSLSLGLERSTSEL